MILIHESHFYVLLNCEQVYSESVSKALILVGREVAWETARFVGMFDKFLT